MEIEIEIARILIVYPDLVRLIDFEIENEWNEIYKAIGEECKGVRPSKVFLKTIMEIRNIVCEVDIIYEGVENVSSNKEIAKRDLIHYLRILKEVYVGNNMKRGMRKALGLIDRGKYEEADNIIRGIRYRQDSDVIETKQLMIESVVNTTGFRTGVESIDKILIKGELTSIVSDSGAMKTYFTMWLMLMILKENKSFTGLYFEKEMPAKDIGRRLLSWLIEESSISILEKSTGNYEEAVEYYKSGIDKEFIEEKEDILNRFKVIPNNRFDTPIDMLKHIENYEADIWVLDYMTQISSDNVSLSSSYNIKVMDAVNKLKQYASDTETHGILINQTSKSTTENKDKRIINAKDIEWSKNIENVSSNIWSLFYPWKHREDFMYSRWAKELGYKRGFYYIIDLKNRNNENSKPIGLMAVPTKARFEELDILDKENANKFYKRYIREMNYDKQKSKRI